MTLLILIGVTAAPVPMKDLTYREGPVEVIGRYRDSLDNRIWLHESRRPSNVDERLKYEIEFHVVGEIDARLIFSLVSGRDNLVIQGQFVSPGHPGVPMTQEPGAPADSSGTLQTPPKPAEPA